MGAEPPAGTARVDLLPAVNQIETHPFFQRTADHQVMIERGVQHESWGPLGQGRTDLFTNQQCGPGHPVALSSEIVRSDRLRMAGLDLRYACRSALHVLLRERHSRFSDPLGLRFVPRTAPRPTPSDPTHVARSR